MAYNALAVANEFIERAKAANQIISPLKLQKLIAFAHGWHLALYGEPLIDEEVQAWDYGPVVASVYHEFKNFGSGPITRLATDINPDNFELYTPRVPLTDKRTIPLIAKIWEIYGKYSAIQLANLTHEPDSAWSKVRAKPENNAMRSVGIPNDWIKEEFEKKRKK